MGALLSSIAVAGLAYIIYKVKPTSKHIASIHTITLLSSNRMPPVVKAIAVAVIKCVRILQSPIMASFIDD